MPFRFIAAFQAIFSILLTPLPRERRCRQFNSARDTAAQPAMRQRAARLPFCRERQRRHASATKREGVLSERRNALCGKTCQRYAHARDIRSAITAFDVVLFLHYH
jgi:hypothetical protein